MSMNDPVLEVLREMRGDLVRVTTEVGRLVRQVEYTNARLDEHGELLREHGRTFARHEAHLVSIDRRLGSVDDRMASMGGSIASLDTRVGSLERHAVTTNTVLELLHAGVQQIIPALAQGRLRDDRLDARVDSCEHRLDALEHDESR